MNSINNIGQKDLKYAQGRQMCIQEKMDMPHVWVRISKEGGAVILRDRKPIDSVDRILDSTYKVLQDDLIGLCLSENAVEKIVELCGPCELKIFYLLDDAPLHTEYRYLFKNAANYFLSDIWFLDSDVDRTHRFTYIDTISEIVDSPSFKSLNLIVREWDDFFTDEMMRFWPNINSDAIFEFTKHAPTISHKNYISTVGFIIKVGDKAWEHVNVDYLESPSDATRSECRKKVLEDFIEKVLSDKEYIGTLPLFIDGRKTMNYSMEQIYIDVMQKVFLQYINVSDFVKDSGYTEEDLTPPYIGKNSELDMSMITNDSTYAACKYSKKMQALLKLLIHTFYRIKSYSFYSFNEFETKKISDFLMLFS